VENGAAFLAECIESVLAQTYAHFEYIIFDDASTDATLDIALAYARKDKRHQGRAQHPTPRRHGGATTRCSG